MSTGMVGFFRQNVARDIKDYHSRSTSNRLFLEHRIFSTVQIVRETASGFICLVVAVVEFCPG